MQTTHKLTRMLHSGQLFLSMLLQVLGSVLILIALAVEVVAFSMHLHLCHVHNLSKQTLLQHDSSASCTDCNQSDGLHSSSFFLGYSGVLAFFGETKNNKVFTENYTENFTENYASIPFLVSQPDIPSLPLYFTNPFPVPCL